MARRDGCRSTSARIGAALGVACVVLGASATTDEAPSTRVIPGMRHENEFQSFLEKYSKKYCDGATAEEACEASLRRQKVYYANIVRYDAHNADPAMEFKMVETKFSDLEEGEFEATVLNFRSHRASMLGESETARLDLTKASGVGMREVDGVATKRVDAKSKPRVRQRARKQYRARQRAKDRGGLGHHEAGKGQKLSDMPEFTWRKPPSGYGNVVGRVHNQQDLCASCWAFVTVDSIASRVAVINKGDDAPELSVKQLMACDDVDHACSTGNMYTAYEWLGANGGISTADVYNAKSPGEREDDPDAQCFLSVDRMYTTPGMCDIEQVLGEEPLYRALYERGPVAVGINANKLQSYGSGVITLDDCHPLGRGIESINHAALVVGWGTMPNGMKYWELKNSYGADWGDQGFFKLERGRVGEHGFGTCGLLFESVYPIVTKPGSAANADAPCVEGSVFKQTYYRNETLNPGLTASSLLGNETSAQTETETHHPTVRGARAVRAHRTAALGTAHSLTDHHAATLFAALAGVCAAAALAVVDARRRRSAATEEEAVSLLV